MTIPFRSSAAVIGLPIMTVMLDMSIMEVSNGSVQFYQQQMLNPWNLARAVISDAR